MIDSFLDEVNKKIVNDRIRQRKQDEKLTKVESISPEKEVSEKAVTEVISDDSILSVSSQRESDSSINSVEIRMPTFSLLYEKLCDAIILANHVIQEAIFYYYQFEKALIQRRVKLSFLLHLYGDTSCKPSSQSDKKNSDLSHITSSDTSTESQVPNESALKKFNTKVEITADDIDTEDIEGMENIINTFTQSKDIYEDILREEPDFSSIKSNEAIPDYGPCMKYDTPILTEDPLRSLMLNICSDMVHWTCIRGTDKRGTLYYSCSIEKDSNLLLLSEDLEFDDDDDLFEKAYDKCFKIISKVPLLRFDASVFILVVLLPCRHKAHFRYIGNKNKLCPKCLSIDNLEKEGYYISPTFDEASKKRKRKDDSRKSIRDTKVQTIICELSICLASKVLIGVPPEDSDMRKVSNQFHKLYYKIDNAEKKWN
ncbi:2878_t:CDS:2 [Funneliformis mosseae]|uniref:2878_t:CDS:1 n=1 Tax=Funneliformis mosseae TaxID=27381 RepID=A0A9N9FX79_FUNMO|nr:2878_t:CDS:2 [Funneliformis mosseae]